YGNDLAPPESAPNPVTNLRVNPLQTSIQLNWDPPIGTSLNVLRYEIWRSVDGTGFVLVAGVGAEEDEYIDTNTLSGQHVYQYRVRVVYTNSEVSADKYSTAIVFIPADEDRYQPPAPPEGGGDDGDVVPPAPPHY
ncbi:MAG: fibronectin type III domain-containing protein, partial [Armatimonadota bacterium]